MTTAQVAEALNVTTARVRQLLTGEPPELRGERFGPNWLIRRSEVERYRRKVAGLPEKRRGRRHKATTGQPAPVDETKTE